MVHLPDAFWVFMLYVYISQSVSLCTVVAKDVNLRGEPADVVVI